MRRLSYADCECLSCYGSIIRVIVDIFIKSVPINALAVVIKSVAINALAVVIISFNY